MENLNLVFQNYIDKFDEMNDEKHNETYKWVALEHFRKNWDIESSNFAAMFKEAVSKTDNLIDNSKVHPTTGIVRLAKEDPNAARALFRDLYKKDKGDLQERQDRIEKFIVESNALLEKHGKGTWKYTQDRKTAIFYLNLRYPDENYIFKSTEARKFAECVEYDDSWGSGKYFKLAKYYKMCDYLVSAIEDHPDLLAVHQSRNLQKHEDRKYHVLAYDIIYCAHQYKLYENIVIRPKKSKTASNSAAELSQSMMLELAAQQSDLQVALAELESERNGLEEISIKGMTITHKAFGPGTVLEQDGAYIIVQFETGEKRFALPEAFSDGYFVIEDPKITERYAMEADLLKIISDLQLQLKTIEIKMK
ncbi:MAG TPA: hypothetical protein VLN47_05385 [Clostridiaceae bacterium]|nr:hypothetical protein [Clostridiaceae bacterium]